MKAYASQDMPLVTVVMSIYRPNVEYLAEQLDSINGQEYPAIEVVVLNDDPSDVNRESFIREHIMRYPVRYVHGQVNRGYVKAFEKLVFEARGRYIAFCDQDDIWRAKRVSTCMGLLRAGCALVCCDRAIIDGSGELIVESWRHTHPREIESNWNTGDDFTVQAAFRCFSIGMATMMDADLARVLAPFPDCVGHDSWLALGASELGRCGYLDEPLVEYRIHGNNETGAFNGIVNKRDWYETRVLASCKVVELFGERFPQSGHLDLMTEFANARMNRSPVRLLKFRRVSPQVAIFEAFLRFVPDRLFQLILKLLARRTHSGSFR